MDVYVHFFIVILWSTNHYVYSLYFMYFILVSFHSSIYMLQYGAKGVTFTQQRYWEIFAQPLSKFADY